MQKQIGCSGKSLSHYEHRRAVRPAGGSTGCQGLSAVFMGHVSHVAGGIAAYPGMGLYVQDGGFCLAETEPQKPHMVLRAGLLDKRERGNLPAGKARQTETPFCRCPSTGMGNSIRTASKSRRRTSLRMSMRAARSARQRLSTSKSLQPALPSTAARTMRSSA